MHPIHYTYHTTVTGVRTTLQAYGSPEQAARAVAQNFMLPDSTLIRLWPEASKERVPLYGFEVIRPTGFTLREIK